MGYFFTRERQKKNSCVEFDGKKWQATYLGIHYIQNADLKETPKQDQSTYFPISYVRQNTSESSKNGLLFFVYRVEPPKGELTCEILTQRGYNYAFFKFGGQLFGGGDYLYDVFYFPSKPYLLDWTPVSGTHTNHIFRYPHRRMSYEENRFYVFPLQGRRKRLQEHKERMNPGIYIDDREPFIDNVNIFHPAQRSEGLFSWDSSAGNNGSYSIGNAILTPKLMSHC
ncbi:MAG: hypothetical protein EOP45_17365 [Sphingobacteriaceae bacterium]|nr:MAG: hypothetical protein EOP45_17365 [Sphingobacteriaceae bacterium]